MIAREEAVTSAHGTPAASRAGEQPGGAGLEGSPRASTSRAMPSTSHRATSSRPAVTGRGGLGQQPGHRPLQRAADQRLLVRRAPRGAEPSGDLTLDHEPERLGVDEQPVQVEQDAV